MEDTSFSSSNTSGSRRTAARNGLWIMIGLCVCVFLALHAWNLSNRFLEFKWDGVSLGNYSHQLWNIAHSSSDAGPAETAWFKVPAVLYLLAPLYRLWPNPLFLPIVQTAALAAAAVALFFMGSQFLPKGRAMILALLFCFYPPIYAMCTTSFHPSVLALPFLTAAILCLLVSRFRAAGILAALILLCDLRAGLIAVPLCLWAARSSSKVFWYALAGVFVAAAALGWRPASAEEGIGPWIILGALSAPYLILALCVLERWADRALSKRSLFLALVSPIFFAGAVFASAIITPAMIESHPGISKMPVRQSAMRTLIGKIPADAQVLTTRVFLPRFSNRADVALLGDGPVAASSGKGRYALADLGGAGANLELAEESSEALRELVRKGWAPVESLGGVVLFSENPGANAKELFVPDVDVRTDRPYLILGAKAMDVIELLGFTMSPDPVNPDLIRFSFYWRKLKDSADAAFAPQISVVDGFGRSVYSVQRLLCYGLYPLADWEVGEVVKDEFLFVVPERLQESSYEVRLGLLSRPHSRPVSMRSPIDGALDAEGRVRLIALDAI